MKKLGLFLIGLLSMIKSVSAADFYDFYKLNINFGFIKDVELWVFVITWAILFLILNAVAKKVPLFREDNKNAAIFSVLVSIAAMVGSPVSTWMMATVIVSPIIIFFLFFLILVWTAISYFLLGGAKASETWGRASSKFRMQKRASKQIKDLTNKAMNLIGIIKDKLNHIPDPSDGAYDSEAREAINTLNELIDELDNTRIRIKEEDPEGESKSGDDVRKAIDAAHNAIDEVQNGNVKNAKKDIGNAEKELKRALRRMKGFFKKAKRSLGSAKDSFLAPGKQLREDEQHYVDEGVKEIEEKASQIIAKYKSDYNEMIKRLQEGVYTQDQAKEWQKRAYDGFKEDLSGLNYSEEQINSYWEKEIWSQGMDNKIEEVIYSDEWKKFIQKKIDKTKTVLKSKRRLKNVKEVKDKIRRELDDDNLLQLMNHFGYSDAADTWKNYFDESIAYFESDERNRRDEKTWRAFEENVQKYKSFLESVRDKL